MNLGRCRHRGTCDVLLGAVKQQLHAARERVAGLTDLSGQGCRQEAHLLKGRIVDDTSHPVGGLCGCEAASLCLKVVPLQAQALCNACMAPHIRSGPQHKHSHCGIARLRGYPQHRI